MESIESAESNSVEEREDDDLDDLFQAASQAGNDNCNKAGFVSCKAMGNRNKIFSVKPSLTCSKAAIVPIMNVLTAETRLLKRTKNLLA